jgi:hypothetical protein
MCEVRAYALCRLNEYLTKLELSNIEDVLQLNRKNHFIIFELCVAFELSLYPWADLPKEVFTSSNDALKHFVGKSKKPRDYGIDCASLDLTRVAQAKWYKPNSNISFQDISTFYTLSTIVGANEIIIATSADVKLAQLASGLPIIHICLNDARFIEICSAAIMSRKFDPMLMTYYNIMSAADVGSAAAATNIIEGTNYNRAGLITNKPYVTGGPIHIIVDDSPHWIPGVAIIVILTACILGVLVISFLA